eukprot:CAMPEP_0116563904 /NCGR_PEP_ID=MMETSP0397-20121206/13007_1 /TAXON_ID=216820 /ORGANISM="Cyclophora tenuis, Strain ECT3854" /LENGTH=249 /DNA_ID=CAMNT_0004090429 /DNA_START=58 /DNA_END=807 /DNA_ORIENTATION=+
MVVQHNGKNGNNSTIERCQESVKNYKLVARPKNPDQVLERAFSKEGTAGYNLVFRNCEHFCNWCITGKNISTQIMRHSARVAGQQLLRGSTVAGTAIVASELSWEAMQNIRSYLKKEITGKQCARGILNASLSVGGGVAGAAMGAAAGKVVAGKVGSVVGAVVGGALGQHVSTRAADKLTKTILLQNRDDAIVKAYDIIQVEPNATNDEVNSAYRRLALERHPDRGGNQDKFVELSTAIEIIRVSRDME